MTNPSLPDDPRLAELARALGETRWGATMFDAEWRLVWVSEELKSLLGTADPGALGYGLNMLEVFTRPTWARAVTRESRATMFRITLPYLLAELPGGRDALRTALAGDPLAELVDELAPAPPPPVWAYHLQYVQGDLPPLHVHAIAARLRDDHGELYGIAVIYGSGLPAGLLSLVARGDERLIERMAALSDPGRHQVAILFADLESSGTLSRHLPSAAYFALIRAFTTTIDSLVIENRGVIGKHAGDGVTAFFLAENAGSASTAARAAIEAARGIATAIRDAVDSVEADQGLIDPDELAVNVGVHWGDTVYMGQLVTDGRLEVTAMGDEVNECARIQQSARGGEQLASKALLEQLEPGDAVALGVDPDHVLYRTLAELPGAAEKAVRDAGTIPVTALRQAGD